MDNEVLHGTILALKDGMAIEAKKCKDDQSYFGFKFDDGSQLLYIAPLIDFEAMKTEFARYRQAEAEGRLHIAPVADGTTVYELTDSGDAPYVNQFEYQALVTEEQYGIVGEDWFLTEEAALAAMERGKGCAN